MEKKRIMGFTLSFIAALFLTIFAVGAGCYFGFIYEGSLVMAFSDSSSFDIVRDNILDSVDYESTPQGVDKLLIERIISKDIVRSDLSAYIYNVYKGSDYEPDYRTLEVSYYSNITYMMAEKNIIVDDALEREINNYLPEFKEFYKSQIKSVSLSGFTMLRDRFGKSINIMVVGSAIGVIGIAALLMYIERDRKNRLQMISIGLLSSGIMTMIVPSYMLISGIYFNMQIWTQYMYELTMKFLTNGFITLNFFGIVMLGCGVIFGAADWLLTDKNRENA